MYKCPNCNFKAYEAVNYCPECGSKTVYEEPVYAQEVPKYEPEETAVLSPATNEPAVNAPTYSQPANTPSVEYKPVYQPATYEVPNYPRNDYNEPKKPHLAKKIVGMALSIGGFIFAIIASLYTIIFSAMDGLTGFILGIVYAIIGLPPAIIGLTMSAKNAKLGDTSAFSRLGKIFGIIAIVLLGVGLTVGMLSLGAGHSITGFDYY